MSSASTAPPYRSSACSARSFGPVAVALGAAVALLACRKDRPSEPKPANDPPAAQAVTRDGGAPTAADAAGAGRQPAAEDWKAACSEGMVPIPGGRFWVGSTEGRGAKDERPRFQTHVSSFCMDKHEVTVSSYMECVKAERCAPVESQRVTCTASGGKRPDHPINCVTWYQARDYCAFRGARLPTEVEWEYAASGGEPDRLYSWGNEHPDGRTCWKEARACPVGSYAPGAFALHDMTGNVWEWTDTGYGSYPWPPVEAGAKVYRGGSWSRRFEKWMRVRLRNWWAPHNSGSHLGFRCAMTPKGASCAFGRSEDGACLHGVLQAECGAEKVWNGARCARDGEPRCPPGHEERPGFGCVGPASARGRPREEPAREPTEDAKPVVRVRTPEFDEDCRQYQAPRPKAWRYEGGTHAQRNAVSGAAGCKNRDVGVGWNSTCCP